MFDLKLEIIGFFIPNLGLELINFFVIVAKSITILKVIYRLAMLKQLNIRFYVFSLHNNNL